ncbi:WXG100-like domain-containing protein, partial [Streptomyces tunisiensis]|uniref:WXG100-like domain-containing protein n=1 Tax=Streptomyces tunisiensis TaxID=948699 RepID=UPI00403DEA92
MSIMPSPEVNAMIFILTGERLIDADEDLAYESRGPYARLGRKIDQMSALIQKSVHDIGQVMPDDLSKAYAAAMGTLTDDGGRNYLREFSEQLDKIAEGRRKTSMDIMESKWQVIAEVIRLLIEIAIYLAMSFFTGGASASQIMLAKMRSRFFILSTLSHLLQRLHIAPSLTEAFSEAFTTFAVRLAMMNFAPDGRRPDGFDWNQILKDGAFGAAAGALTSIFAEYARKIVKSYDDTFLKNATDLDFKPPPKVRNDLDLDAGNHTPNSKPDPDTKFDTTPDNRPDPVTNNPGPTYNPPTGFRDLFSFRNNFRNNPDLWRNNQILRNNADRPGAIAGHYGIKGTADFLAAGSGEALAEILVKGAFDGDWSTSWSTFVGAGISSQVEATLTDGAKNGSAELRNILEGFRDKPPTVSGGDVASSGTGGSEGQSRTGGGTGRTDGPSQPDTTGGTGTTPVTSSSDGGVEAPPPYSVTDPPPYTSPAPPPYSPGTLPVTATENALWQQVHRGNADIREQALRDLTTLRGAQPPGATEIGVRDALHGNLSGAPEIRVVPVGSGPATEVDADGVRRALEGFGTPVTVTPPLTFTDGSVPVGEGSGFGPGTGLGADVSAGVGAGAGEGAAAGDRGKGTGAASGGVSSTGVGSSAAPGTESGTGVGSSAAPGAVSGVGVAPGTGSGTGVGPSATPSAASGTGVGSSAAPGAVSGVGVAPGTGSGTGAGPSITPGAVSGTGVPPTAAPGAAPGTGAGPSAAPGAATGGTSAGPGAGAGSGAGTGNRGAVTSDGGAPAADQDPRAVDVPGQEDTPVSETVTTVSETVTTTDGVPGARDVSSGDTAPAPPEAEATGPVTVDGDVSPLTVVVSEGPPPAAGSPEAAALLDEVGADRAVVLGPPAAPDSAGRPNRTAVELTRETPDGPVQARPLTGPAPVTAGAPDPGTVFPGADVLLPLADALGAAPDVRPVVTESGPSVGTGPEPSADVDPSGKAPAAPVKPVSPTGAEAVSNTDASVPPDGAAKFDSASRPWSEPATVLHVESADGGGTPPVVTPPPGSQVVVRPAAGNPRPAGEPALATLDGRSVPLEQVRRLVPDTAVRPEPGRTVRTLTISQDPAEDGTARDAGRRALLGQDSYRGVRTESGPAAPNTTNTTGTAAAAVTAPSAPRAVFTGPTTALPGVGTEQGADYFVGHGTPRAVTLGTHDASRPTVKVSGVQLGEALKAWAADDDRQRPLVLYSCETGRQPRIAGLPVAQHVANRTGRPVYAPTSEVGTARDKDGNVRAVLVDNEDGPGRWRLFTPEPGGADLDQLARDAGLHAGAGPADPFARARTLQQIRTLRDALGPDAEKQPGNRELLAGLAHVDGLRWQGTDSAARYGDGRMTLDLLRRMVTDWHRAGGGPVDGRAAVDPSSGPTPEHYTAFLRAAAAARAGQGPGTTLDDLIPPPPPTLPPTALVSQDDVRGLDYAQSAQVAWGLSDDPLPLSELGLGPEDTAELARRRPDLSPAPSRPASPAGDLTAFGPVTPAPERRSLLRAGGLTFRRIAAPPDGNCFFRSVLDSARSREVPPAWAAVNADGLRARVRDRVAHTELGDIADALVPDPVHSVVNDLRLRALAGESDAGAQRRIAEEWDRIAQEVVTDGDTGRWREIVADSDYPGLAEVAPTPADARRLGGRGLLAATAARVDLWPSPFADLIPEALAHTLDLDLRIVQPDPRTPGALTTIALHAGGTGDPLHVAYNGTDHFDALVPDTDPSRATPPESAPEPVSAAPQPAPDGPDPYGDWLREMAGITDTAPGTADEGDKTPLETQLDRYRPPRLLTGPDARRPGPAPRTVTFEDGSRLPAALIRPGADPGDTGADGTPPGAEPTGLFAGTGVLTLRAPELAARQILDGLPDRLRARFDEEELRRLLTDQPSAFTAPRGARLVGREKSGVGLEMTVEAVPYHRWVRLTDTGGGTVKADTARRGQSGTGGGRTVGFGRRIAGALSMGPPLDWLLKIGASLGWARRTDYNQGTTSYQQAEHRAHEGSHLHLDDVHYRVRVHRVTEAPRAAAPAVTGGTPGTEDTTGVAPGPRWTRQLVHTAEFGMRDGLSWRLPDDLTVPYDGPRRAPRTLTFPEGEHPRLLDSTGLYLTDPAEDVALALSGARPGSSAHRTLVSYTRPGRLLGLFGRLTGTVSGPGLTRGRGQRPLGHLVVERSVPHRADLVTESTKVEVRDLTQTTYSNQRGHVRETRFGLQVTSGPNHQFAGPVTDVRVQGGPMVRTDLAAGRGHYLGTDAARKVTGRVRNQPMALYRVERTLMVRGAGEPRSAARPVRVVSLDWMSTQDARRLAGWDSRTPGRTGPNPDVEPPVPWYLRKDDPVHLGGQVRAEGFRPENQTGNVPGATGTGTAPVTGPQTAHAQSGTPEPPRDPLQTFADTVLDTLHASYPSLFLPPAMRNHPRLARLWYSDERLRTAWFNERQVSEALNRPTLAQALDDLTTTGVPVTLVEDGKVRRGHHTLTLRARLTDRRFETTLNERTLRNAVIGNEVSGQGQQQSSTYSAGVEVGISPRDHDKVGDTGLPRQIGNLMVGGRYAHTRQEATRNTVTVAHDHLTAQSGIDLYSYRVELRADFEGHRRPRGWPRLLTAGLLGVGVFVSTVAERPLFRRGAETVGRVELAVPAAHGSDRYAPTDLPAAPSTDPSAAPATSTSTATTSTPTPPASRRLSALEAGQLLDGAGPVSLTDAKSQSLVERLLGSPHVVLSTQGGPQRQELVQETADRASGDSWHTSAPGTPVRTALRRAVADLSVTAQLNQYLGPFGTRVTGLHGAGPFRTHYLKAAVRGELENVRVMSDPKPSSLENTVANDHKVTGSSSTTSRTTLGLQGSDSPLQQASGAQPVSGSYGSALQYAWGRGRALAQSVTRGRSTTMTYAGRMYLVVADAAETVAVRDRWTAAMGTIGTRAGQRISSAAGRLSGRVGQALSPRRAAAALHRVRDAVMFHLPMQDAIETGLAPDGLGTGTPRNLGGGYRVPGFLRGRRFPTHPSGRLDASSAAQQLLPRLEKAGVPSHDREQVLQRLSPDFLLAHLHELTTDGVTLPVRHRTWSSPHHLPVGGSPAQVRFKLTPAGTTVKRLRTGYEVDDYRTIARDSAAGVTQDRGGDLTLSVGQRTPGSDVLAANPSLQGTATGQRAGTRTDTLGSTAMPDIATTQAHAEVVTGYILTVTMTDAAGDPLAPRAVAHVGTLHELVSAGLLTPSGTGDDGTLTEQDVSEPERAVRMLTAEQARREAVAAWRADGDDILPFDDRTGSGMLAVDIRGAANVENALTLATARADGLGDGDLGRRHTGDPLTAQVRMARHTPLTALGSAPAQAQQEATSQGGLTAGFREALGGDGSVLPTQSSARLFGQSHTVESRLYAKMHRRGARLLAVESAPRMEGMQRHKTSQSTEAGITDNTEGALGTAPLVATGGAGLTNPGVTGPVGGAADGIAHKGAEDVTLGTHVKYGIDRSMLFALPVSWLAVSEADHRITDSRPLRTLGKAQRGPRAAEAETTALVWLREDQARDYGLLDDSSFPEEAAAAWDDMAKAAADLAVAEKEYYDARARTREAWLSLAPEERAALGDGDPGLTSALTTVLPRNLAESPAVLAWQAARDDAHLWEGRVDAAAADHHRLHLAASRLTAHHQGSAAVPVRDVPQEYTEPGWRSDAPAPYTVTEPDGTGVRTLTSPDGAVVRAVHEVPHDGASFFHALIAAAGERGWLARLLGTDLADRFTAAPGDPEVTADAVHTARDRLARELGRPDNRDLLDSLAPDTADTFTQEELDGAGITLSPEQQAEFDALGRLPETFWPTPAQRAALASLALARPFATEPLPADAARPDDAPAPPARRAGDHGGADLLPALAARLLGTSLTVVTGEGRAQRFLPYRDDRDGAARDGSATVDPAADPVLFAADGHFHAALSAHAPAPSTTALPAPAPEGSGTSGETSAASGKPSKPAAHRSHTTAPWLPPADGDGPRYRLARDGVLTAPDGATYTQGPPTGRGNGFFGALSTALRHAAAQPNLDSREAGRLRLRADASAARLMRLNGLPGTPSERTSLFSPPPLARRRGAPEPSAEAKEGHLRRHLAEAPWTSIEADLAVARWAAAATGATVTLVEENGTAHTYLGPGGHNGPHLRLRRRGGDFVPLIERTPAPTTRTSPTDGTGPDPTPTAATVPLPPSTPASPSSTPPPSRLPSSTGTTTDGRPATETAADTTTAVTATDTVTATDAGPPGLDGDDAYELSPLAGDRGGQGDPARQLTVGRRAGAVLHSLGHPVVLAGAARGRVQFGTPRPLDAVEFGLPGDTLPTAASVRRALEQEFPGARVRPGGGTA